MYPSSLTCTHREVGKIEKLGEAPPTTNNNIERFHEITWKGVVDHDNQSK